MVQELRGQEGRKEGKSWKGEWGWLRERDNGRDGLGGVFGRFGRGALGERGIGRGGGREDLSLSLSLHIYFYIYACLFFSL